MQKMIQVPAMALALLRIGAEEFLLCAESLDREAHREDTEQTDTFHLRDSIRKRRSMNRKTQRTAFLLLLPGLSGVLVFFIIPLLMSMLYAFTQGVVQPHFVGLENFSVLLKNTMFLQALKNTVVFLAVAVPLALVLAVAVSVIVVKATFAWQTAALLLPMVVPASSLCVGWQALWSDTGPFRLLLELLGIGPIAFLEELPFALLVALYLLRNVGYLSVILTNAIRALPPAYRESYCLDSSSEVTYIRCILLPLIAPTLLFAAIVSVMNYFLLFRDIYFLYGSNPPDSVYMLQHFMNNSFYKLNYPLLSSAAFLTVLILICVISLLLALQKKVKHHVE